MQKTSSFGISLPTEILKKIDAERHDISRSKFVLRIIEFAYIKKKDKENTSNVPADE